MSFTVVFVVSRVYFQVLGLFARSKAGVKRSQTVSGGYRTNQQNLERIYIDRFKMDLLLTNSFSSNISMCLYRLNIFK